ncbi:MAG: hypothetical protein QOE71_2145 [Pseudonocardiales bacterium]|nr:hypothetical protein [Pseudonocardiales bacterium]
MVGTSSVRAAIALTAACGPPTVLRASSTSGAAPAAHGCIVTWACTQ